MVYVALGSLACSAMAIAPTASVTAIRRALRCFMAGILTHCASGQAEWDLGNDYSLIPDADLENFYPRREAIVELFFTDGTTLKERVDDISGTLENPMTREEVVPKCQDLMADFLGREKSRRLIEGCPPMPDGERYSGAKAFAAERFITSQPGRPS